MPKALRTLRLSFCETHLTHFGGMVLWQRFCNRLGLRRLLQQSLRMSQPNADYHPSDLILALLYAVMAGLRRINKTEIRPSNGTFLSLPGLPPFPDPSTLGRFLKRMSPRSVRQLVSLPDPWRAQLFPLPRRRTTLRFDLDSVVLTVYGKQQFARVGYNPKKHSRRSYQPLICFEAHWQEFWQGSLRPGHVVTATGVVALVQRCLHKVPSSSGGSRVRVRADSGCFGKRLVEFLDTRGCGYTVVAKQYSPLQRSAHNCEFQKLGAGWEVGQFRYQPHPGKRPHRLVVVRRPIPQDPVVAGQPTLFKDSKYAYHVLVTNLRAHPWRGWMFYAPHATIEKDVRELLYDYPLGKIPTDDGVAHVAFFQRLLLAYNLVHWFKRLCLPKDYRYATLDTIGTDFLVLPAKLTSQRGRNVLILPHDYLYQEQFKAARKQIERLRLRRFCK